MKRIISIGITWFCAMHCFCQSQTIQLDIQADTLKLKGSTDTWSTHVNSSGTQSNALITFADRDRVYYFLIDPSFHIIGKYAVDKDAMSANYYGSKYNIIFQTSDNTSFKNYIYSRKDNAIIVERVVFDQNTTSTEEFLHFGKKEKFLTAFEDNNHLYFLTLLNKSHKLHVFVDSSETPKEIELRTEDSVMHINLEKNLEDIVILKNTSEPDLYTCKNRTKLYIQGNGQIVLTLDSNLQYTTVFKINLNNFTSESKFIRKSFFYCNNNEYAYTVKSNSYVYQDKILQGVFCKNDLLLQLKYISSDSLISEWHAERDSLISFASSDLIKREEGRKAALGRLWDVNVHKQTEKELKTKDFFKAVNSSDLSFLILAQDEYFVVKIGEAHDMVASPGRRHFQSDANRPGGSSSYWSRDMYVGGGSGVSYRIAKSGETETYFKAVFKQGFTEFIPSKDVVTKYDKIDLAVDKLKDVIAAEAAFDFNQHTLLFYLDKKQKRIIIERIE